MGHARVGAHETSGRGRRETVRAGDCAGDCRVTVGRAGGGANIAEEHVLPGSLTRTRSRTRTPKPKPKPKPNPNTNPNPNPDPDPDPDPDPNAYQASAIFCTDPPKQIKEKVNKYAFSGGRETVDLP